MRLLRIEENGDFSLIERVGRDIPRYAILSHTWGPDDEEVNFKDLIHGTAKMKAGYRKISFCGNQATNDGLQFFWVDTCCIDKSSSAELSEAINSMFRWYHNAIKCYVYLSDVSVSSAGGSDLSSQGTLKPSFQQSKWFTRGWTLQELLAPTCVDFFSVEGERLGDRSSLVQEIHDITRISIQALQGRPLPEFSVDERMLWAEKRETKREEDTAYCLLGIFDIYMPLIYGEGQRRALRRLHKEIREYLEDELSALSPKLSTDQPKREHEPSSTLSFYKDPNVAELPSHESVYSMDTVPMWPGSILRTNFSGTYLQQRDKMSDAAYSGRWAEVLELLEVARDEYGENWANVVRLRYLRDLDKLSFWTPLHQAAYLSAPINVIKHLIANGSSRTLRTRWSDAMFKRHDLTAAEIAQEMGDSRLAKVLAPVIRHFVPQHTIARLQALFHAMIREDCKTGSALVLPELVTLTELNIPEMWFPLGYKGTKEHAMGYHYRLETRELVVTKLGIEEKSPSVYRISEEVVVPIQHPTISKLTTQSLSAQGFSTK